jgi:hypothetical protein
VIALLAVVLLDAATAPPVLLADWKIAPTQSAEEYARYVRHEQDGTDSAISGSRKVCNCQPDEAVRLVQKVFANVPGASTRHDSITACGHDADRVLITGVANQQDESRHNIEVVWFRDGPALYMLMYAFRYAAPMLDAESALTMLCQAQSS